MEKLTTIDQFLHKLTDDTQLRRMQEFRQVINSCDALIQERIMYGQPTFTYSELRGAIVHIMPWKAHIGLYPGWRLVSQLEQEGLLEVKGTSGKVFTQVPQINPK